MEKKDLHNIFTDLTSKNGVWWHDHQSYKECILGSDGSGHDLIHPVDKLRASLRNLWSLTSAVLGLRLQIEEKEIEVEECKMEINSIAEIDFESEISSKYQELRSRKAKIELERAEFGLMCAQMQYKDRLVALTAFYDHSNALYEQVKDKYKDYDDALEDIWTARLAYQALVGGHPVGNQIKIAMMDEEHKEEALKLIGFPVDKFKTPNANEVLEVLNVKNKSLKERVDGERLLDKIW